MQKENAIKWLSEYCGKENSWRDTTLVMPRLAFLARLSLKKYGKIIEKIVGPYFPKKSNEANTEDEATKSLLQLVKEKSEGEPEYDLGPVNIHDELLNALIIFSPGALSISATVKHLFSLLVGSSQFLSSVENELKNDQAQEGNNYTFSRLNKLPYLDAVLKETLRLEFTLASFRFVGEDILLHDGFVLPAGSHFILTGSAINYDEQLFPDSHTWNPQRWVDLGKEESQQGLKFSQRREAFIWGSGKVICPGRIHAVFGMKLMTSLMLRNFTCESTGNDEYTFKARRKSH